MPKEPIDFNKYLLDNKPLKYSPKGNNKLLEIDMHHKDFQNMSSEDILTELSQFLLVNKDNDIQVLSIENCKVSIKPDSITQVLEKLPKLQYFNVSGDVKEINFSFSFDVSAERSDFSLSSDFSLITLPPKLQCLELKYLHINNQKKLPKFPNSITKLNLSFNDFDDLSGIELPTELEELDLSEIEIKDPKELPPLKEGLKILKLRYSKFDDLSDFNIPSTVQVLNLDSPKVNDLNQTIAILTAKLEKWQNITMLSISNVERDVKNNITPETVDALLKHYKSRKELKIKGIDGWRYNTSFVQELTRIYKAQTSEDQLISSEDVGNMLLKVAPSDPSGEIVNYIIKQSNTPGSGYGSCPQTVLAQLTQQKELEEIGKGVAPHISPSAVSTSNTVKQAVLDKQTGSTPGRGN